MDFNFIKSKHRGSFDGILLLSLLLVGSFHEASSCILSVVIAIVLLMRLHKHKKLAVGQDLLTSAVVAICLCYGLTCFWAIDKGMAWIGFLKFLPVVPYLIYLQQQDRREDTLALLPWFGVVSVVIAGIGMQFPLGKELFSVAGRLSGFFQYPNTYAIFLLVCELLILRKENRQLWDYIAMALLIAGFLYTGSRTAFAIAVLANGTMLMVLSRKRVRAALLGGLMGVVLLVGLLAINTESVLYRYLTISFTQSTFVGRLLYWVDALPLLLKYPFGMGYMGYYYIQQSIQTGVYSVAYIHNDFLQILLDIGWLPAALIAAALVQWFLNKEIPVADKIIVGALCIHSLFEFHMQYMGMVFLLLLLLSSHSSTKRLELKSTLFHKMSLWAVIAVSLYMGSSLCLSNLGMHQLSEKIYPYNTQNKLQILENIDDLEAANQLAGEILEYNQHCYVPYSIRARYCYSQGDIGAMIENGRKTLERTPFTQEEYEIYCKMLISSIDLYTKAGDFQSAKICREELLATAKQLSENPQRLSALGKRIKDQPVTVLSSEVEAYIRQEGRVQ